MRVTGGEVVRHRPNPLASKAGQLFLFLTAGGAISLWRRKDVNWDLQNYHFYNPWAWLNDRIGFDLAPAQIQSYFSPFLDLPFFLLVRAEVHPALIGFVMGLPFGVALAFFFWVVRFVCTDFPARERATLTILSLLVALTGAAGLPVVGSTMNEWHTAALVMPAVFIALKLCAAPGSIPAGPGWTGAGFLLGAATGLKLTAAPYGLAVAIAALLMHRLLSRSQLIAVLGLAVGGLLGFAVAYGYWGVFLFKQFGNPVFPFLNHVFQSPDWFAVSWRDRFGPNGLLEGILFPLRLAERSMIASNVPQRDPRIALLFVALALVAAALMLRKIELSDGKTGRVFARSFGFLLIFTISAYVIWLIQFSIYRYFIPAELIASLLMVVCLWLLLRTARWRTLLLAGICLCIVGYTDRPGWGRTKFGDRYFNVAVPSIPQGSLVLLYGGQPLGYVLPFLGPSHRYVRPSSNFTNPSHSHGLQRAISRAIEEHRGPIYALRMTDQDRADETAVLTAYRLRLSEGGCLPVHSDIHKGLALCQLIRVGN